MKGNAVAPLRLRLGRGIVIALAVLAMGCDATAPAATGPLPGGSTQARPGETATTPRGPATSIESPGTSGASPGATTDASDAPGEHGSDGDTSERRIADALAAGRIDYPTSVLYRAYAAFGSPLLPEEYRGVAVDLHAATFLFAEIAANEAALGPDVLAALAPYTARPNDPVSIFSREGGTASRALLAAAPAQWVSRPAAGGKARVWVVAGDGADGRLAAYASEVDAVWPKVFALVPEPLPDEGGDPVASVNPDSAIDLYFADAGSVDPRVWSCRLNPSGAGCAVLGAQGGYTRPARPFKATTSSGFIMIDAAVSGDRLTSHIAHELVHTSQYQYDYSETPWLLDSTATWGAYRVLQHLGVRPEPAYEYLPDFFASLDEPLRRDEGLNRYASWLYFLSLQIDAGDGVARAVFEKMAANGQQGVAAVDQAYPFEKHFGTFAMSNWNEATADRYREQDGTFSASLRPRVDEHGTIHGDGETRLGFETGFLSADYAVYEFSDEVGRVLFRNPLVGLVAECACVPSVWLIAKIDGEWKEPEAITEDQKRYCRSRPGEHVEELVIVVANPDPEGLLPLPRGMMPTLEADEAGCGGGGTITYSREKHGTYTSNRNNPVQVDMSEQATITFDLVADEYDIDAFAATRSSMTWSYSLTATESADGCSIVEKAEGGGTIEGEGGPTVNLGLRSDGTIFGITFDENAYTVNVLPPAAEMPEGDPRGYYEISSDICGEIKIGGRWPYNGAMAIVSGDLPAEGGVLSGSRQRTIPPMHALDVPTVETITWTINLE